MLASKPPMLPRWSLTDPRGRRRLLADCQPSNPSKALKSSKSSVSIKGPHLLNEVHPLPRVLSIISSSSPCPEYNINSPVVNRSCPDWVHLVSQSPSMARLNLRISAATCAVFPASYIVRTFRVSMFKVWFTRWQLII